MTAASPLPEPRLRVGIQGEAGCFSHAALDALLGDEAEPLHYPSFVTALDALETGEATRLLLPVHNSLAGVVQASLAAIARHDLRVDAECELPVRLVVAGLPGAELNRLREALSHPVALRQCRRFLAHHPHITDRPVHDTAGAARLVRERQDPAVAAVTSVEAARAHGLSILATDVQDRADNVTRFWLLARRRLTPVGTSERIARHLEAHVEGVPGVRALRGAIPVAEDSAVAVRAATRELLDTLLRSNGLAIADVRSAVFTLTPDLSADFPATAAREAGWQGVPMLCATEVAVPAGMPQCLRALLHVTPPAGQWRPAHAYLGAAQRLRPDL